MSNRDLYKTRINSPMTKEAANLAWVKPTWEFAKKVGKPTWEFLKRVNQAKGVNRLWNASVKFHKELPLPLKIPVLGLETAAGLSLGHALGIDEILGAHAAPYAQRVADVTTGPLKQGIREVGAETTRAVNRTADALNKQSGKIAKSVEKIAEPVHGAAAKVGASFGSGLTGAARGAIAAGIGAGAVGLPTTLLTAKLLPEKKHQALRNIINTVGMAGGGALGLYVNSLLKDRDV